MAPMRPSPSSSPARAVVVLALAFPAAAGAQVVTTPAPATPLPGAPAPASTTPAPASTSPAVPGAPGTRPATPTPSPAAVRAGQDANTIDIEWTGLPTGEPRPGTSVCAMLRGRAAPGTPVVCVRGTRPMTAVVKRAGATTPLDGVVRRTGRTSVAVKVDATALRLRPGAMRLMLLTRGGTPDRASTPRDMTWRSVTLTGCTRSGAGQVFRGPSSARMVALSFDDGPSTATPAVLALLARHDAHATFFQLGQSVGWRASDARRVLDSGNSIGSHSWSHARFPSWSDLSQTNARIRKVTGFTPCVFRPPYGLTNSRLVADANSLGMTSVLWSIDTNDWRRLGVGSIEGAALRARPGDIVLMHDGGGPRGQTVAALADVLPALKARGIRAVTVEELLGFTPTYVVR